MSPRKKFTAVLLLGFSSGLPLALVSSTLQIWFTEAGIATRHIGLLALISLPYFFKFCWAPLCDSVWLPLGRRRGWMLSMQIIVIASLLLMSSLSVQNHAGLLAAIALLCAFASATQDIAINALQTDILAEHERGLGAALYVGGYRAAMFATGGFALILADHLSWQTTYRLMALAMLPGILTSLWVNEPLLKEKIRPTLNTIIIAPFAELLTRKHMISLLGFVITYKLTEAFTSTVGASLVNTFLIRVCHFSLTEIGIVNKFVSFAAVMLGMFIGGLLLTKISLKQALLYFGLLQVVGNGLFILLTILPKSLWLLGLVVGSENLAGGLVTAALIALIMSLCDQRYSATQFALLTALSGVGRFLIAPLSGYLVAWCGWHWFFILGCLLAIVPLMFLPIVGKLDSEASSPIA